MFAVPLCPTPVPSPTRKGFSLEVFVFFLVRLQFINNGKGRKLFRMRSHRHNKIAHATTEENFAASNEECS